MAELPLAPLAALIGALAASAVLHRFARRRTVALRVRRLAAAPPHPHGRLGFGRSRQPDLAGFAHHGRRLKAAALAVAIAALAVGQPALAIVATAAAAAVALADRAHRLGAGRRVDRALAPAMEQLARQLRSGASLPMGLAAIASDVPGELGVHLRVAAGALQQGGAVRDALETLQASQPRSSVRLAAAVLAIGHRNGGVRAQTVDELAAWLREDDESRREAVALAGQAQASALVMVLAPIGFAVLLGAGDPAARRFLLDTPAGLACLGLALALDLAAAAIMVRAVAGFGEDGP
ncbi:MAG: type II secretion system F family protein [Acidimicrobiales bacterium]